MRDPSGLKAAERTSPSWPPRTATALPVTASQTRAVLSSDAVTMRAPSGLKAAEDAFLISRRSRKLGTACPNASSVSGSLGLVSALSRGQAATASFAALTGRFAASMFAKAVKAAEFIPDRFHRFPVCECLFPESRNGKR